MKNTILYIDDEPQNLTSFKAALRRDYHVLTTTSTPEALEILQTNPEVSVVISDQRMPIQTGTAFFEELEGLGYIQTKIILTGQSDYSDALSAINNANVFKFLEKPWNVDVLKKAISEGVDLYEDRKLRKDKPTNTIFYTLAHDLKSPLSSIQGLIRLAKVEKDASLLDNYLNMADKRVDMLFDFIQEVLDFYKNDKTELKLSYICLADEINEILSQLSPSEEIEVSINIDPNSTIKTDPFRIGILLRNIISNALKYRVKEKKHRVAISHFLSNDTHTIIIKDNGVGIEEDKKDKIFDLFFRGQSLFPGTGVGLHISSKACTKLGGKITVSSKVKEGSEFKIMLPVFD